MICSTTTRPNYTAAIDPLQCVLYINVTIQAQSSPNGASTGCQSVGHLSDIQTSPPALSGSIRLISCMYSLCVGVLSESEQGEEPTRRRGQLQPRLEVAAWCIGCFRVEPIEYDRMRLHRDSPMVRVFKGLVEFLGLRGTCALPLPNGGRLRAS